jgi:hypothetical protein
MQNTVSPGEIGKYGRSGAGVEFSCGGKEGCSLVCAYLHKEVSIVTDIAANGSELRAGELLPCVTTFKGSAGFVVANLGFNFLHISC